MQTCSRSFMVSVKFGLQQYSSVVFRIIKSDLGPLSMNDLQSPILPPHISCRKPPIPFIYPFPLFPPCAKILTIHACSMIIHIVCKTPQSHGPVARFLITEPVFRDSHLNSEVCHQDAGHDKHFIRGPAQLQLHGLQLQLHGLQLHLHGLQLTSASRPSTSASRPSATASRP